MVTEQNTKDNKRFSKRWTKRHDKMVEDAELLFRENKQGEEIDI